MTASAYSIDGQTFTFETSLDQAFPTGSYVTLTGPGDHVRLGQVLRDPRWAWLLTSSGPLRAWACRWSTS